MSTLESASFKATLRKTNQILRAMGLQIEKEENDQTMMSRIWNRKLYCFLSIILYGEIAGEVAWFVEKDMNFIELTYTIPLIMLCCLSSAKGYYRIKNGHRIIDVINSLHKMQALQFDSGVRKNPIAYGDIQKIIGKLEQRFKIVSTFNVLALVAFFVGPLSIMAFIYHATGEVEYRYPLLILYPFNPNDPRIFPFVFLHQVLGGIIAIFSMWGPDCLYYILCTFIQVQFRFLQYDIEIIIMPNVNLRLQKVDDTYRKKFRACITHHMELIRLGHECRYKNSKKAMKAMMMCCNLLEITYSKSNLSNFMSSSLLLCLAGFNIMAHEDIVMFDKYLSFLIMCLIQIYLICDYGDKVSQASMELSNAVYNSQWYMVDAKTAKDLLMILTRAQKPCELTAYYFTEVNRGSFTRILSTSWSYFALLQSVYNRGQ